MINTVYSTTVGIVLSISSFFSFQLPSPIELVLTTPLVDPIYAAYIGVFTLAAVGCFLALFRVTGISDRDVRWGIAALLVTCGIWATSHVGYLAGPTPAFQHLFYMSGLIVGIATVGPWLYFCSAYTGRTLHRNRGVRRVAIFVYLAIISVKLTNPIHGWYYSATVVSDPFPHLLVSHEPLHWIIMGFAYALALVGFFMLFELFLSIDADVTPLAILVGITGLPIVTDVAGVTSGYLLEIPYSSLGVAVFAIGVLFVHLELFESVQLAGTRDEPLIIIDGGGRIRGTNRASHDIFPELEDARGRSLSQVLPNVDETLESSRSVLERHEGGDSRYFRLTTNPISRGESSLSKMILLSEITDRKKRELELTQSRERLSVALDVSNSGVWEWDPKTDDVHWHESCERLFGLEPGTFEGTYEAFLERVHDEDVEGFEAVLSDAVPDREPFEVEGRIVRVDGETRWVKSRAEFVVTHESPRYIGVVTDVTELKDRERKIQEERAFLESTIDALPDVFYAFDDTGTLSLHNDRLETVTGYDVAEIQGMEPWEFVPDEERDVVRDAFKRVVEAGESAQVESQILTKGGETIPYEFVGGPLRGTEGSVEGVVGIGRDVTERVEYERRLTKLHETTQRLMQAEDVETVGEIVCEASRNVLGLSAAGMVRYDEEVEGMVPIELTDGLVDLLGREPDVFPEDSLPEIILREGDELVYHDIAELDLPEFDGDISEGLQFATPLDDRTMFGFTAETPGPVDQQILELARILAEQTTAALERIDRERELRMKTRALDSAPVGITISDPDLDDNPLIYVNDRYTEITGYSEAEATGRNCRYLQGEETNPEPVAQMRTAIDEDRPVSVEVLNYRKDGAPFWNNVKIAPVEDEDGTVTNYVGFQQDVTERKEYESELRETKRKLEAVLDTIQAAVFMKDTDSRYLLMNQACRDLLGVDEDAAVVGTTDHELFPDDVAQQFREDDRKVFEREETVEIEEDVPTPDGTRPHLTRKSPVYDETGEPYALCAVSTDVSELKQREKELEQFAYAASHDLREPLRVISNYLQLLERRYGGKLDEDALEYVDYAVDASERMKDLIDGLLTYSRVGRRGGEFEPTDLNEVLSAAQSNLEIAIEQTDATIEADELPIVRGDDDQLLTVFQNLLDNAIIYAGDEPPEIEISVSEETDEWVVTVADEGIGIDPDQAHRAFEIFERLHDDDADGTGMGLALCKKIVDRHGGTIWIDSVPGEGTAVNFTLPKHVE